MKRSFISVMPAITLLLLFGTNVLAEYREVDVKEGGSISGKVSFAGDLPGDAVEKIDIVKNMDVCGEGKREVVWVDVKGGALRGAFVFIDKIGEGKRWTEEQKKKPLLDQKGCRFEPGLQIFRQGPMRIRNSDKGILHNVNMREMIGVEKGRVLKRSLFNIAQPETGVMEKSVNPRRSPYLSITCEIHNFMFGHALVSGHPYAVIVDEKGAFRIDDVPPGTYDLKVWHPKLGIRKSSVTVTVGKASRADFEFAVSK